MNSFKEVIRKNISNIPGWRTKRKILVIESDDWGSVRIKDRQAYLNLKKNGLNVDEKRYDQVDTLESNQDLEMLFEVLASVKDRNNSPAKVTPMCLVGNPDFDKIKASGYQKYYFQPLDETIKEFPGSSRILELWNKGASENIFVPELHGREHINVQRYMEILRHHEAKEGLRFALDCHSVGPSAFRQIQFPNYLGALHPTTSQEIGTLIDHLREAGDLFKGFLGYSPRVFMAPNAEEPKVLESVLKQIGVKYLTRSKRRVYPKGDGYFGKEWNFFGKINDHGQLILNRNAFFEPCQKDEGKTLETCLNEIGTAYRWGKPAVISTHRVNYVGSIDGTNRDEGLRELQNLLRAVLKKWPDTEFMTSAELGDTIRKAKEI
jgi:hypothetical protein